jgi:hypothetical protein
MGSSDSSRARRLGLATLVGRLRLPSAPSEVSHVQRFPFATCRPWYPGGARRCVCRAPSRRVLPSHANQCLGHHVNLTGLRLGSLCVRPIASQAMGSQPMANQLRFPWTPRGVTEGAWLPVCSTVFRVGSFHPTGKAPPRGARLAGLVPHIPRAVRAGVGGDSAGAAPTPSRAAAPACRVSALSWALRATRSWDASPGRTSVGAGMIGARVTRWRAVGRRAMRCRRPAGWPARARTSSAPAGILASRTYARRDERGQPGVGPIAPATGAGHFDAGP